MVSFRRRGRPPRRLRRRPGAASFVLQVVSSPPHPRRNGKSNHLSRLVCSHPIQSRPAPLAVDKFRIPPELGKSSSPPDPASPRTRPQDLALIAQTGYGKGSQHQEGSRKGAGAWPAVGAANGMARSWRARRAGASGGGAGSESVRPGLEGTHIVCVSKPRLSARGLGAGRSASCRRRGRRAIVPRPVRALLAEIVLSLVSHHIQEGTAGLWICTLTFVHPSRRRRAGQVRVVAPDHGPQGRRHLEGLVPPCSLQEHSVRLPDSV